MTDVYVVCNQLGHYWGKAKIWVDGSDARAILRSKHEDEAINTLFELSSKDFELRGNIAVVELDERGKLVVEPSEHPLPVVTSDEVDDGDVEEESGSEPGSADPPTADQEPVMSGSN